MIRIPRAVFEKYHLLPYAEVEAAAQTGTDGLILAGPRNVRGGDWPCYPPQKPKNYDTDINAKDGHDRNIRDFEFDVGHAYVRCGDDLFSKGQTLLYMRGW